MISYEGKEMICGRVRRAFYRQVKEMADQFFPNVMPHFMEETALQQDDADSLLNFLFMPYPYLS